MEESESEEKDQIIGNRQEEKVFWEKKFNDFKQYVNKLNQMSDDEFKIETLKFLRGKEEEDNIVFRGKRCLIERMNECKAFYNQMKQRRVTFNKFFTSRLLFTPSCEFNTGKIYK